MTVDIIASTPWLSLRVMRDPAAGVDGYVYSHEDRCDGSIVAVLPYRIEAGRPEVLLRREVTPAWSMYPAISAITGGVEKDDTPLSCVIRELEEEAGYEVGPNEVRSLGTCRGTKSTDTTYHLFTADLSFKRRAEARGDGSRLEALAECFWSNAPTSAVDPMVAACFVRLLATGRLGQDLGRFH